AIDVGDKNRRHERLINLFHQIGGVFALCADDNPIRMHQIVDRTAFAQEFRITDHVELRAVTIITLNRFGHFFAGLYWHGAFIDDHAVIGEDAGDLARDFFDETQIDTAIALGGSRHGNKNDL